MKFSRPPIYPFWLWNGEEQESEITRQLALIAKRGLPGVAIHARTGNMIPYLSPRWMELFRHACIEAKKHHLAIWIYDELGFPSGTANGRLPATGEDFQQKSLHFEVHPQSELASLERQKDVLRIFPKSNNQLLVFRRHVLPQFSDFLNPKTAPLFLKLVHQKYYRALKEFFGNVIQAVFTDDNLFLLERGAALPYTDSLEKLFHQKYGYSLLDNLDALVENRPESPAIRLDYYRLLSSLLNDGFIRPMQNWCTDHRLKFYGHLSSDEGPLDYCVRSFGDLGAYMETLNVPGCDDFLTMYHDWSYLRNPRNHFGSIDALNGISGFSAIQVMRQASSVASQLGDGTCMSETFSSLGWGVSPASLIAHMNFLCLMGINISVPHYYTYSTGAQAKRDHPASFFFQQPYFAHSDEIFAETDRTLQLTARGVNVADTLVIHPIDSVQATLDGSMLDVPGNFQCDTPSPFPSSLEISQLFQELSLILAQAHIGFEYGYESVIQHHGSIPQSGFKVGKQLYHTIILPHLVNISSDLCNLLRKAKETKIIYLGDKPTYINGLPADPKLLPPGILCKNLKNLKKHLPIPLLPHLKFQETGISCRLVSGKKEYMVAHYGKTPVLQHFDLKNYSLFDPTQNRYYPLPMDYTLQPGRAIHLLPTPVARQLTGTGVTSIPPTSPRVSRLSCPSLKWSITPAQQNNLLIDAARPPYSFLVRFDDPAYAQEPQGSVSSLMLSISPKITSPIFLYFEPQSISLLKLNGVDLLERKRLSCPQTASLSSVEITDFIRHDDKDLLTFAFSGSRPEFLYLAGQFLVDFKSPMHSDGAGYEMAPVPIAVSNKKVCKFGDLTQQGFPFYWGSFIYSATLNLPRIPTRNITLEIPKATAAAIRLVVNGTPLGSLSQTPWRWNIPANLLKKKNSIELELMNTAQNFFGPHHPDTQRAHFSAWRPANEAYFSVAPFGILQPPKITLF